MSGARAASGPGIAGAEAWQAMQTALALHRAGNAARAAALCRRIPAGSPQHPDALHLLGLIAYQDRDYAGALDLIGRAVTGRDCEPAFHCNLARVHEAMGRVDAAVACYRRALAIDPRFPEANSNLGGILANRVDPVEGIALCRRALEVRPDMAAAWCNLGIAQYYQGDLDAAADSCRKALERQADSVDALHILACCLVRQGQSGAAIPIFERALVLRPEHPKVHDSLLFALLYRAGGTDEEVLAAHRRYADRIEAPLRRSWPQHANRRHPERRLRIGYVSPDFRNHSVAFFAEPLLANHDRRVIEVFCYYDHVQQDDYTARFRATADRWLDCSALSGADLARRIQADGIDILVDLAGHSSRNRLPVFARRPAPVQVTWLGYPATTGLSAIDYRLTDADVDPEGSEAAYSERLYRLPRTTWCYRPPADVPDAPMGKGRAAGQVCFGSLNNFSKVSPATLELWARVLAETPGSRLVMTHVPEGSTRDALRRRFADAGIAPDRLRLHGRLPAAEFRAVSAEIDIALDPFPYNGTTTTCEALWMGIPVVTLIGASAVSRSGFALLRAAGLGELCAADEAGYVGLAVGLAVDPARLEALRSTLRTRMAASPLRDEAGFARDVESAYRALWRAWCEGGPRQGAR